LILIGWIVYAPSLNHPFVFDDEGEIVSNERIRSLWPLTDALATERPVVTISFALNYALGGLDPWGYRAVNVCIHILAAMTLAGLVRRTLLTSRLKPVAGAASPWIALAIALIWLLHPLQTQSVTYVVQRGESLMGLLYLLTLYGVVRGAESPRPTVWYVAAVAACAFGMGSKAVMVTAPLMVLIFDRAFLANGWKDALSQRAGLYAGLAGTWIVLLATGIVREVVDPQTPGATVGFGVKDVSPATYALTQAGVKLHYIKLALWPNPLCLDYGWQPAGGLRQAGIPLIVVAVLLMFTVWAVFKKPVVGFVAAWFFLILAPTSSFIPVAEPIFEHRMYLPLAAIVTLAVMAVYGVLADVMRFGERTPAPRHYVGAVILIVAAGALGFSTMRRNRDYRSAEAMWADVLNKRPNNPRAHQATGLTHFQHARFPEAEVAFKRAIKLKPAYGEAHFNLGNALMKQRRWEEAVSAYRAGIATGQFSASDYYNLGNALKRLNRTEDALSAYSMAVWIDPSHAESYLHMGNIYMEGGVYWDALAQYGYAIEAKPDYGLAYANMGAVLMEQARYEEALEAFDQALAIDPGRDIACQNREQALLALAERDSED
jgi:tetratricopeptide (TPR) repeat protein